MPSRRMPHGFSKQSAGRFKKRFLVYLLNRHVIWVHLSTADNVIDCFVFVHANVQLLSNTDIALYLKIVYGLCAAEETRGFVWGTSKPCRDYLLVRVVSLHDECSLVHYSFPGRLQCVTANKDSLWQYIGCTLITCLLDGKIKSSVAVEHEIVCRVCADRWPILCPLRYRAVRFWRCWLFHGQIIGLQPAARHSIFVRRIASTDDRM